MLICPGPMSRMVQEMRAAHPERARKTPVGVLSSWHGQRMLSMFDASLRTLQADLGVSPTGVSVYTSTLTGVAFRPAAEAVRSALPSLIELGLA